jgi:hypothetical protein
MAIDKAFYEHALPFLSKWTPALRTRFAEGMALLQRTPVRATELDDSIGIVLIGEGAGEVDARYMSRSEAIFRGKAEEFSAEQQRAISVRPPVGSIAIIVIAHRDDGTHSYAVIQVPVRAQVFGVESRGSEGN